MRVLVKKPGFDAEICEVNGLQGINKLVGNVDENGHGLKTTGSDARMSIGNDVDLYMYVNARHEHHKKPNIWSDDDNGIVYGTIVFAGYDSIHGADFGVCSLSDEQIYLARTYINLQKA